MGTPPASASLDQMRNVQRAASCGGESVLSATRTKEICRTDGVRGRIVANNGAHVASSSGVELLFASGSDVGAVFLDDVAQQVLFAQQPGWHAFSVAVLERMHDRAERRT